MLRVILSLLEVREHSTDVRQAAPHYASIHSKEFVPETAGSGLLTCIGQT